MSRLGCTGQDGRRNGVSGPDARSSDMPRFPRTGRLGGEPDELVLDMILKRASLPPGATPEMAGLPEMLADLAGPAEPDELAGEAAVLARFRSRVRPAGGSGAARRPAWRKAPRRRARYGPRLATGLVVAAIGLGGSAAAYAGVLPGPLQDLAHILFDAPSGRHVPGHQSGVVPGHRSGVAHAVSPPGQQAPQSGVSGSTAGHRAPGIRADPARSALSAAPRLANDPSPQPGRHGRRSRPARPSRTPSRVHHLSQVSDRGVHLSTATVPRQGSRHIIRPATSGPSRWPR